MGKLDGCDVLDTVAYSIKQQKLRRLKQEEDQKKKKEVAAKATVGS